MNSRLGDRVSASEGCEAAVTVRTRCGRVTFRECGEFLYDRRINPKEKGAVYRIYVKSAILYES